MATPIKMLVSEFQARKIATGNQPIIIQVRRKTGQPVQKFKASLCDIQEMRPPRLGTLVGGGLVTPAEALYRRFVYEVASRMGHDGPTERREIEDTARHYLKAKFHGAFSKTEARNVRLTRAKPYMVVNTGEVGRGEHWQAAVYHRDGDILYDSLGGEATDTDPDAEQTALQDDCGQRSLAFLRVAEELGLEAAMDI